MNEYILNNPAKKRASIWSKLVEAIFSQDDQFFPFWVLLGPVFSILSGAFVVSFFPDLAVVMGFILALSLLTVYRFRLIGLIFSTSLVIYPIFVKASCPSLLKAGFFLSFVLSFIVFLLSIEEFYLDKENTQKQFAKAKEEASLWSKRFETLSSKQEELKSKLDEQERAYFANEEAFEKDKKALEELVKESSLDAVAEQKVNAQLRNELVILRQQIANLEKFSHKPVVDEELYLKQIEEIDALKAQVSHLVHLEEENTVLNKEITSLKEAQTFHAIEEEEWIRSANKLEMLSQENETLKEQLIELQQTNTQIDDEQLTLLREENDSLKEVVSHLEELNKQQAVDAEDWKNLLNELNDLRIKYHQLEMLHDQNKLEDKNLKKQDKKKRISDDELLFSFYGVSHSAVENVLKYRQSQIPS